MNEQSTKEALLEHRVCQLEECQKSMQDDIKDIKEKLLGRPSWFVCGLISTLCTISSSLAVAIILMD